LLSAVGDKTFDPIAAPICKAGETKSTAYLAATLKYLKTNGHSLNIQQVLISLEGLQPRIAPQHDAIVQNLATLLAINSSQIGLTYTTGEGLNDCGKGLGMNAKVIVTVIK
jgi:2-C-methyl-D-erythritol 2,4-cyclodiphosphate synthase